MAWGSKTQIANGLSVGASEVFSDAFTLNPGESAHIQVEADFPASPVDDLEVRIYTTLDDSSENWDDTEFQYLSTIDKDTDPNAVSYLVGGIYKGRLGFKRSGSTDTIIVNAWLRKDGVSM